MSLHGGLTMDGNLVVMRSKELGGYGRERALRRRIESDSQRYLETPISEWPPIVFNWDLSKESQRFSKDGVSSEEFSKTYPHGFCLGYVSLVDFDQRLCFFSRRKDRELWTIGDPYKLAYLIVYLSEGRPISPPFARPVPGNEIVIDGGHHRYAVAKAIGEPEIPLYVSPRHKEGLDSLLNVKWIAL